MRGLIVIALVALLSACAAGAQTDGQRIYGLEADLSAAEQVALGYASNPQADPGVKDKIKALDRAAYDAVQAAQVAYRKGGSPELVAALSAATSAVDALSAYVGEQAHDK